MFKKIALLALMATTVQLNAANDKGYLAKFTSDASSVANTTGNACTTVLGIKEWVKEDDKQLDYNKQKTVMLASAINLASRGTLLVQLGRALKAKFAKKAKTDAKDTKTTKTATEILKEKKTIISAAIVVLSLIAGPAKELYDSKMKSTVVINDENE